MSILAKNRRSSGKWGTKNIFFSLSKKLVLSIIVVKLDFMCQIQKMYYGYFSISINFRPQYLVFSSKMFGYGSVTVRPFLLWFGFGSAEHEKSLFGRPLVFRYWLMQFHGFSKKVDEMTKDFMLMTVYGHGNLLT